MKEFESGMKRFAQLLTEPQISRRTDAWYERMMERVRLSAPTEVYEMLVNN